MERMQKTLRRFAICLSLVVCTCAATELRPVGVLGNSGEQGEALIRYAEQRNRKKEDNLGARLDRFGTVWDRAGLGRLNRYSLDGRLLASLSISSKDSHLDRSVLVGDHLLLSIDRKLYVVDTAAATPSVEERTGLSLERMAESARDGRVLMQLENKETSTVIWYEVASGKQTPVSLPKDCGRINGLGIDPAGHALVVEGNTMHVQQADGSWQRVGTFKLGTPTLIGEYYWGGAWHGTAQRFNSQCEPDPGVVLGGASGSFIGKLEGNYEVNKPSGINQIDDKTYLIGGTGGVAHIAVWRDEENNLALERRIGGLHGLANHVAIDGNGRVHVPLGFWDWSDGPASPLRLSRGANGNGQAALFDEGQLFANCFVYGASPAVMWGGFDKETESTSERWNKKISYFSDARGCTVLRDKQKHRRTLRIDAKGVIAETRHEPSGKPIEDLAVGKIHCTPAVQEITSLASLSDGRVLLAADGAIIEIERADKGDWRETKRLTAIAGDSFGTSIHIYSDGQRLFISDTTKHRVLVVGENMSRIEASFGGEAGDDLTHLDRPTGIAANGSRLVVYDSGNQRLMKFELH